ncbi:MAG: RdgB/HAM1 family non-canonical purine NTP pyrophosphatase [Betaproteobacteria bacterium]|nr:RdgB/HAM1 family non-canonical purine NTP pyrophosphatase [Betaproteobacteria bacterium]
MTRLVIASNNAGKLAEISAILAPLGFETVPQGALGVPEAQEPHHTFVENALAKARNCARHTGLAALADDSGLCVEALGGAPGVHSAYFAGRQGTREERDHANNALLVEKLEAATNRQAHYYCVMVLVRNVDDPEPLIAEGRWQGEIASTACGTGGFGYDPYFRIPALGRTAAQLPAAQKNRLSHRAIAASRLAARLRGED